MGHHAWGSIVQRGRRTTSGTMHMQQRPAAGRPSASSFEADPYEETIDQSRYKGA